MSSAFMSLPEPVLQKVLGGMLLTHYRSAHPKAARLLLMREVALALAGTKGIRAEIAIFDEDERRVVAIYELITTIDRLSDKRAMLQHLVEYARLQREQGSAVVVGVVVPESVAQSRRFRDFSSRQALATVTYPG